MSEHSYLCILDYEASCWENDDSKKPEMEIIEFPSILYKIDDKNNAQLISEFSSYVRPTRNPKLSKFCTQLTGITQEQVDKADVFEVVYNRHIKWLLEHIPQDTRVLFATCGHWDLATQLPRELKNKNLKKNGIYKDYINVKDEFEYFYKKKAGGLTNMLKELNMKFIGKLHSGYDDSKNISRVMLKMLSDGHTLDNCRICYIKQ
jgi:inhibitor of KinA sporulation pathway (predicted exonuclease)